MVLQTRRVVTGLNAHGRSALISDGPTPCGYSNEGAGIDCALMWRTETTPASNQGREDAASGPFPTTVAPREGSCFYIVRYPPAATPEARAKSHAVGAMDVERSGALHATASVDYIVMLSGEITMILETGEVTLRPGDTLIDRGVAHAWENRGAEDAVFASIAIGADAVARGE